jgi:hypothetical protein
MSRVLGVKKGFRFHEWNNRINRMSYDFVICEKAATVIATIELDDKSHESEHRRDSDAKGTKPQQMLCFDLSAATSGPCRMN